MAEPKKNLLKRTVEIEITPQAEAILSHTEYSLDEFLDWMLNQKHISFGGHNVCIFLEHKHKEKMRDGGSGN